MNAVLKAIGERRAVRDYTSRPVSRDVIEQIINAGNQAPSAMNSQPWRFVVVTDDSFHRKLTNASVPNSKKILELIKDSNPERYESIKKRYKELPDPIYYSAPLIIFVIGQGRYADLSCPLACENMMLAAYSLGLGSCWVQFGSMVADDREIKDGLELKEDEKIFGPVIFGYTEDFPEAPPKKAPVVKWI